jgi:hypothetical protein
MSARPFISADPSVDPAGRLAAALAYAERGWHVFPVVPNGKEPLTKKGLLDATSDKDAIRQWWGRHPDANIGLALRASGLMAVDIDSYKPDCKWSEFVASRQVPATLIQRSARGGTHLIFSAEAGARYLGKPCAGVDGRHNNYILVEPSSFDGGTYQWQNEAPIAPAPDWLKRPEKTLAEMIGNSTGSSGATLAEVEEALQSVSPDCDYDTWLSVLAGIHNEFGGDGLTLADEWSARAPHRYKEGEVETKFASFMPGGGVTIRTVFDLARKAGADLGQLRHKHSDVLQHFKPYTPSVFEVVAQQDETGERGKSLSNPAAALVIRPSPFTMCDPKQIPPRQWLYGRHLIRGFVSLTVAPGGLGKSSLLAAEILAMTAGRPLLGDNPAHPLRVWLWNGEDPYEELQRRLQATCLHFGIEAEDMGGRLLVDSGRDLPISIASTGKDGTTIAQPLVSALVEAIKAANIDVLVIDPFVTSHSVPENDTTAMNAVVAEWRKIADLTDCAIELVHHVNKAAAMSTDAAGIYGSRGAGALIDGVRSARYLSRMSVEEGNRLGVDRPESFFRVEMGKANLAPIGTASWRRMVGVPLHNGAGYWPDGDVIGVCTPWAPPDASEGVTEDHVQRLLERIAAKPDGARKDSQAAGWVGYDIADVLGLDVGPGKTQKERTAGQKEARAKVTQLLERWVRDRVLVVQNRQHAKKPDTLFQVVVCGETMLGGVFG